MKKLSLLTGTSLSLLATFGGAINTASALEFGVFSDVVLSTNDAPGENVGFALGAIDFYATANISDNTRVFVEYVFEGTSDGLVTDLERLWITRTFSDEFSLGAGRFHTPLGTWNRTYHHGAILQDTIARPFFLDFEDGAAAILPVHIVGLLSSGSFSTDSGELSYEAYLANGPSLDTSIAGLNPTPGNKPEIDINGSSDPNSDKTLGFRVTYELDDTPLTMGVMYMGNAIADSAKAGGLAPLGEELVSQVITGLDAVYDDGQYDVALEYYNLANDAQVDNKESHSGVAFYTQFGYRLNPKNKLIYRYANLSFDADDLYFRLLGSIEATHHVVTWRHDLDETNTLKFEFNQNSPDAAGAQDDTTLAIQWSFLVP